MKTKDDNDIKINSILVLTTLTRISKATFARLTLHASILMVKNECIYAHKSAFISVLVVVID